MMKDVFSTYKLANQIHQQSSTKNVKTVFKNLNSSENYNIYVNY